MSAPKEKYVPVVDGLRAVAILGVIAFHAGLPLVKGGFVGVDVFFVISGYLIVGQLLDALAAGSLDMADFWARRVLRILPPYFLVVVATAAVAPLLLATEAERADFWGQVRWSAAMAANHYFLSGQGYFARAAESQPLLHLWSLGVEEQFYLLAPVVLALWWRARGWAKTGRLARVVWSACPALLAVVSFGGCVAFTGGGDAKNYGFFLMPLRAWEFVIGGALHGFSTEVQRLRPRIQKLGASVGLGLVVGSMFLLEDAPFPSFWAAVPVVGTALTIAFAKEQPSSLVARVLTLKPMLQIGLYSYAWYLWHWPLVTFTRMWNFGDRVLVHDVAAMVIALLLAVATHHLLEVPTKRLRRKYPALLGWWTVGVGLAACVTLASGTLAFARPAAAVAAAAPVETGAAAESESASAPCDFRKILPAAECVRLIGDRAFGVVIGDSHASLYFGYFRELLGSDPVELGRLTSRGCSPMPGVLPRRVLDPTWVARCTQQKDAFYANLDAGQLQPDFVVIAAHWSAYLGGFRELTLPGGNGDETTEEVFVRTLHETLERLRKAGVARILVIGPGPVFTKEVPACVGQARHRGVPPSEVCSALKPDAKHIDRLVEQAARGVDGVQVVDTLSVFCKKKRDCRVEEQGRVFFTDAHHLSSDGLVEVHRGNREAFDWVAGVGHSLEPR